MSLSSVAHSYNGFLAPPLVNRTESALAAPPSIPANKALSFRNESDHPEPKILTFTYTPNGDELSTSGDLQMPSYVDLFLKIEWPGYPNRELKLDQIDGRLDFVVKVERAISKYVNEARNETIDDPNREQRKIGLPGGIQVEHLRLVSLREIYPTGRGTGMKWALKLTSSKTPENTLEFEISRFPGVEFDYIASGEDSAGEGNPLGNPASLRDALHHKDHKSPSEPHRI